MMHPPLLTMADVGRCYGTESTVLWAVEGINIQIKHGERVALLGPSGAGKSTLLSLLGLMDRPDTGTIQLDGHLVSDESEDHLASYRRKYIGFLFQAFHLIPGITALDNVAVPLLPYEAHKTIRDRATALLEDLGLADRLHHLPSELSGGEQQRVALARAMISEPALLLADEPTGNLDSRTARATLEVILRLQQERGVSLVMATHDQEVACLMHRQIRLFDGRIQE